MVRLPPGRNGHAAARVVPGGRWGAALAGAELQHAAAVWGPMGWRRRHGAQALGRGTPAIPGSFRAAQRAPHRSDPCTGTGTVRRQRTVGWATGGCGQRRVVWRVCRADGGGVAGGVRQPMALGNPALRGGVWRAALRLGEHAEWLRIAELLSDYFLAGSDLGYGAAPRECTGVVGGVDRSGVRVPEHGVRIPGVGGGAGAAWVARRWRTCPAWLERGNHGGRLRGDRGGRVADASRGAGPRRPQNRIANGVSTGVLPLSGVAVLRSAVIFAPAGGTAGHPCGGVPAPPLDSARPHGRPARAFASGSRGLGACSRWRHWPTAATGTARRPPAGTWIYWQSFR